MKLSKRAENAIVASVVWFMFTSCIITSIFAFGTTTSNGDISPFDWIFFPPFALLPFLMAAYTAFDEWHKY